jgi:hypothetical protein
MCQGTDEGVFGHKNCVGLFEISSTIRQFPKVILLDAVHVTAKKNN